MVLQAAGLLLLTDINAGRQLPRRGAGPSLLVAIGIGLSFVPATIAAVAGVAPHEAGLASGLVNTSRMVGGALGLAILAALATSHTNHQLKTAGSHVTRTVPHAALTSGFKLAFMVAGASRPSARRSRCSGCRGSRPRRPAAAGRAAPVEAA